MTFALLVHDRSTYLCLLNYIVYSNCLFGDQAVKLESTGNCRVAVRGQLGMLTATSQPCMSSMENQQAPVAPSQY